MNSHILCFYGEIGTLPLNYNQMPLVYCISSRSDLLCDIEGTNRDNVKCDNTSCLKKLTCYVKVVVKAATWNTKFQYSQTCPKQALKED